MSESCGPSLEARIGSSEGDRRQEIARLHQDGAQAGLHGEASDEVGPKQDRLEYRVFQIRTLILQTNWSDCKDV